GWIVTRMHDQLAEVFGGEPVVLTLPPREAVRPDEMFWAFTVLMAGDTVPVRDAFARHGAYWLDPGTAPGPATPNGFTSAGAGRPVRPARVVPPERPLRPATDDWPFLYLRAPMVPRLTLKG